MENTPGKFSSASYGAWGKQPRIIWFYSSSFLSKVKLKWHIFLALPWSFSKEMETSHQSIVGNNAFTSRVRLQPPARGWTPRLPRHPVGKRLKRRQKLEGNTTVTKCGSSIISTSPAKLSAPNGLWSLQHQQKDQILKWELAVSIQHTCNTHTHKHTHIETECSCILKMRNHMGKHHLYDENAFIIHLLFT